MKLSRALAGGFAGAVTLTLLNETLRRLYHDAPRIDLLGKEALELSMNSLNVSPPSGHSLYLATIFGDILSNGFYYTTIGLGGKKNLWLKGIIIGLAAGIGAIELPKPLGLNDEPVRRSGKTIILTVSWYLLGGMVTGAVISGMQKEKQLI